MTKSTVLDRAASGRDWLLMFVALPLVLAGCGGGGGNGWTLLHGRPGLARDAKRLGSHQRRCPRDSLTATDWWVTLRAGCGFTRLSDT